MKYLLLLMSLLWAGIGVHAQYTVLHSLNDSDGLIRCSLTTNNDSLYGISNAIFKINLDGTGFSILHSFTGGSYDGSGGSGYLLNSNGYLYGMAGGGGINNEGVVFKISPDGTNFTLLHSFIWNDGASPYLNSLINVGGSLYGMTYTGGNIYGNGVIFKISTSGTFTLLHTFAGALNDGSYPYGALLSNGTSLYGMTASGGMNADGIVFKMNTDGSNFTILHNFNENDTSDGAVPFGSLLNAGGYFYGMTSAGGANDSGTIFKMNPDGTGFTILHSFSGIDGKYPNGSLINADGYLYGMATEGGINGYGTIFKMSPDGTNFSVLYNFNDTDGAYPNCDLIKVNGYFYGTTPYGGANDLGVIFKFQDATTLPLQLISFTGKAQGKINLLSWITAYVDNTTDFDIERSTNGKVFAKIGSVAAVDNARQHAYTFTDHQPLADNNYYRLKVKDQNGKSIYSNIVRLSSVATAGYFVALYPNPAKNKLNISISGTITKEAEISIKDITGKTIKTMTVRGNDLTINISGLSAGPYTLLYQNGEHQEVQKFMVER